LDCNNESLQVVQAFGDVSLKNACVYSKFQFERTGFFSMDPDSTSEKVSLQHHILVKFESDMAFESI
jgi:glutaminyl-tRNA synthetase